MASRYLSLAELGTRHPGNKAIDLDRYFKRNSTDAMKI